MRLLNALTTAVVIVVALIASAELRAQTFTSGMEEDIPASELTLDVEAQPRAYAARYHFGESEWESELVLTVRNNTVTGVLTYGEFVQKTGKWRSRTLRFSGTITGNMLVAGRWKGLFVRRGDQRGLIFLDAPTDLVRKEFGERR